MFTKQILQERMQRGTAALHDLDIDTWISIGRDTHLTVEPALLYLLPSPISGLTALILTKHGDSICLARPLHFEQMVRHGAAQTVISHTDTQEFEDNLTRILRSVPPEGRIAVNMSGSDASADGLSATQLGRLQRLTDATGFRGRMVSSHPILRRIRGQKSPAEIARIRHTVDQALSVFEAARTFIRSGVSGSDIQRFFQDHAHRLKADYAWDQSGNPYCSIGTRSSYLCVNPPADVFAQPGDLINVDFGLRIAGYASDNQRSYYVLQPQETSAAVTPPAVTIWTTS